MVDPVYAAAQKLAETLQQRRRRIVFAESCTAGLVSATLARIPGISEWHCGSAVVYRLDTKHRWLGVSEAELLNPGPVSRCVAEAMARGVLERTPEADVSVAVTGHLGPQAPPDQDGLVFIAGATRRTSVDPDQPVDPDKPVDPDQPVDSDQPGPLLTAQELRLSNSPEIPYTLRDSRQRWAAEAVLRMAERLVTSCR